MGDEDRSSTVIIGGSVALAFLVVLLVCAFVAMYVVRTA